MENISIRIVPLTKEFPQNPLIQKETMKFRSLHLFESAIRSKYTRKNYMCTLKKFMEFVKMTDFDHLAGLPEKEIQVMLENYVIALKTQNLNPNSFPIMFTSVELFFSMNDKILNWKKIKKFYPDTIKKSGYSTYSTEQIQILLKGTTDFRNRSIVLFLTSTGVRIGALVDLKMKHLKNMAHGCKKVTIYENSKEEYIVFLTPETANALNAYIHKRQIDGEILTPESPLFRDKYMDITIPAKPLNYMAFKEIIKRLVVKTGITRKKTGSRYDIQLCHGFRKRFNTILKSNNQINSNIAEKLMGHKNGLDGTYFVPTEEQCFAEFCKAIQDLTIDDSERLSIQNRNLQAELQARQRLEMENHSLQKKMTEIMIDLEKVKKRQELSEKTHRK